MTSTVRSCGTVALAIALAGVFSGVSVSALAQTKDAAKGRIVCWKDKSGKVVGCGDKVPLEYQDRATHEMDRSGVTRKTTESAEEAARRRAQEQEAARVKADENKRLAEQRRQDSALLNTFTSEKEIDQKRDRDLQQVDIQVGQLKVSIKNTADRYNEVKARADAAAKDKAGVPATLKDELAKATADKQRAEQNVAAKEKEKEEITKRYAEQKKRYLELKGEAPAASTTASGTPKVERAR
jgi:chromosome segregation ATPase